jgi:predicted SPOUT superfamily RNA methylase MTH1
MPIAQPRIATRLPDEPLLLSYKSNFSASSFSVFNYLSKIVINNSPVEQVSEFKYLGYLISDCKSGLEDKIQTYNKINGVIRRHFRKQMTKKKQN